MTRRFKLLAAGVMALALVWQHVQAVRMGYAVEKSRRRVRALQSKIASRQLELDKCLSPAQLALKARIRLGMFPALPESLRILGS